MPLDEFLIKLGIKEILQHLKNRFRKNHPQEYHEKISGIKNEFELMSSIHVVLVEAKEFHDKLEGFNSMAIISLKRAIPDSHLDCDCANIFRKLETFIVLYQNLKDNMHALDIVNDNVKNLSVSPEDYPHSICRDIENIKNFYPKIVTSVNEFRESAAALETYQKNEELISKICEDRINFNDMPNTVSLIAESTVDILHNVDKIILYSSLVTDFYCYRARIKVTELEKCYTK